MSTRHTRRRFIQAGTVAGALALAGCVGDDTADDEPAETARDYEVWLTDQGTDTVHILEEDPDADPIGYEEVDQIDVGEVHGTDIVGPHLIDFTSDWEYAVSADTGAGTLTIYDADSREIVETVETGPGTHMGGVRAYSAMLEGEERNDERIIVDVINDAAIREVEADWENYEFEIVDEIDFMEHEELQEGPMPNPQPICHDITQDGSMSYHTVGAGIDDAAVVRVDIEAFEIDEVIMPDELRANCGVIRQPGTNRFWFTGGAPSSHESGGVGQWYVYDADDQEVIASGSSGGFDAHGIWFGPTFEDVDDISEAWVFNRETNDAVVIDTEELTVIDYVEETGTAPDIVAGTPGNDYMLASLRGPEPQSGDPHASTGDTPGMSIIDPETREILDIVEPNPIDESDMHAANVRLL
ncbi:YncE family protein [Natrialbaceae archaeon AArc-T1-2]|uniref:YncE family protein n=1 Tax=Natrialbaceae archaeon AArc-T1-2 TaxID=3053904 RepID=UPI00255AE8BD|nr:cell surface protein [Natrialbaceae archaeon AArc-T1-2]WIV66641.1 cell surface protein [Natrialbaceae archaeon AArc-T1-2]